MSQARRFPAPWRIEEHDESYVVTDGIGHRLAYLYFDDEPQRQSATGRLSKDDAWRIARAMTRLPGLLLRK
jgi:hypothetical protein